MTQSLRRFSLIALVTLSILVGARSPGLTSAASTLHVGAVFPLQGQIGLLARQEYLGVQIARDLVNADGGVAGRTITLEVRELDAPAQARSVMDALRARGVNLVLGAYSSQLSIPASSAAAADGMVYWEAGAVADRLTGRGLPTVFRVGASGSNLGTNSARFVAEQLAPRLGKQPAALRLSIVSAQDDYASSVAQGAVTEARAHGMRIVNWSRYNPYAPDWPPVLAAIRHAHPDVLILASHILDGVAFRRAFLAAHLHVGAFVGSTMAQCVPEFGALLGRDAVGVFASDRPGGGFNPRALSSVGRSVYNRLAAEWRRRTGQTVPTEEGLAGFSAAWALFHDVLPRAAGRGELTPAAIGAAARSISLPQGTLPNGAGLRFATDRAHLGQNLRAAAVIWQWQGVRHSVVVWPKLYATGTVKMVPLPR